MLPSSFNEELGQRRFVFVPVAPECQCHGDLELQGRIDADRVGRRPFTWQRRRQRWRPLLDRFQLDARTACCCHVNRVSWGGGRGRARLHSAMAAQDFLREYRAKQAEERAEQDKVLQRIRANRRKQWQYDMKIAILEAEDGYWACRPDISLILLAVVGFVVLAASAILGVTREITDVTPILAFIFCLALVACLPCRYIRARRNRQRVLDAVAQGPEALRALQDLNDGNNDSCC